MYCAGGKIFVNRRRCPEKKSHYVKFSSPEELYISSRIKKIDYKFKAP